MINQFSDDIMKKEMLPNLRYILRNGERVLQQAYYYEQGWLTRGYEWEDVPLITEFDDQPNNLEKKDPPI